MTACSSPTAQNTAHGRSRDASLGGDLLARPALAARPFDRLDYLCRRRPAQSMGLGGAIVQSYPSIHFRMVRRQTPAALAIVAGSAQAATHAITPPAAEKLIRVTFSATRPTR